MRTLNRREFVKAGTILAAAPPAPRSSAADVEDRSIAELRGWLQSGRESASSLTETFLDRIRRIDVGGPALRSVIELNPEASSMARRLDEERHAGRIRGPLHGIPILIKDNIDTADRMSTTAGSLALEGNVAAHDAFIVRRLREAGVVILGKTNLSEWANFRSSRSTSGWSGRGGQTRNPYALDRTPCGSSSGSGAATAASLCTASIGTETDGSIVCPSSANSLVGIKPTLGLCSRTGIIPIAHSQDTAGPMARSVADAAALLGALAGVDPSDPATRESVGRVHTDYTRFLQVDGVKGARVGVAREFFGFNEHVDKLVASSLDALRKLGATLVDPAEIPTAGTFDESELEVLLFEFKSDVNIYLARLPRSARVHSLQELIEFNEAHRDTELRYFGQDLFLKAEAKGTLNDGAYRRALEQNLLMSRSQGIDAVVKKHRLDAIVAPTGGPPWPTDLVNGDHFGGGSSTPAAVAGYPSVTVPAGYVFGLPVGISFIGPAWSEPVLIRLAYSFEQATRLRRPPKFLASANVSAS